jgi:hypothetical protein
MRVRQYSNRRTLHEFDLGDRLGVADAAFRRDLHRGAIQCIAEVKADTR